MIARAQETGDKPELGEERDAVQRVGFTDSSVICLTSR